MDCADFIPLFAQAKVTLPEFLTIDDERLEEVGIELPFQRNIIKLGLHNFFKQEWKNSSVFVPEEFKLRLTPVDILLVFANALRQITILKCQLIYLKKIESFRQSNLDLYSRPLEDIRVMKNYTSQIRSIIQTTFDSTTNRPLLVPKPEKKKGKFLLYAVPLILFSFSLVSFKCLCRK
jgi:hypothetical protein